MYEPDHLVAREAIYQLKARYCRCMDTKDWAGLESVFAPQATFDLRAGTGDLSLPQDVRTGAASIVSFMREAVVDLVTVHQVTQPEIEILSTVRARGVWAMQDLLVVPDGSPLPFRRLRGFGHYHETYVRLHTGWAIESLRLSRLHVETH